MCEPQDEFGSAFSNVIGHLASWALWGTGTGLASAASAVVMEKHLAWVVHPKLCSAGRDLRFLPPHWLGPGHMPMDESISGTREWDRGDWHRLLGPLL